MIGKVSENVLSRTIGKSIRKLKGVFAVAEIGKLWAFKANREIRKLLIFTSYIKCIVFILIYAFDIQLYLLIYVVILLVELL